MSNLRLTRRTFLGATAAAAAFTIVPRHVLAAGDQPPPSEKLRIACIGVGGRGHASVEPSAAAHTLVAFADVDDRRAADTYAKFPDVKRFRDFRKMFDAMEKSFDAVTVATPDHTHAVAAMAAMQRGKHVYCEKPLAHSVGEVRALMAAARRHKVITQLGNQGHSTDTIRLFCEWIWDGAIGNVHTIHAGCRSPNSALDALPSLTEQHPVPADVDWGLWLGPALERAYHPAYMPSRWRAWVPFGNGTVGDWVCHVVDPVFWALDLGLPTSVRAEADGYDPRTQGDTFPKGCRITYKFPAKGKRGPVTLHWYQGAVPIPRPPELEADRQMTDTGAVVVGEKGSIMYGSHGAGGLRIFPEAKMKAYTRPPQTLPRVKGGHHADWFRAIKDGQPAGSDFSYGGPLTEIAMLGVIAIRLLGRTLEWDAAGMRFTNCPEANALVSPAYRKGWVL